MRLGFLFAVEPRVAEPGAPPPLLSDEFLVTVLAAYAPPAPNPPRAFAVKQLNVSDPLVRPPRPGASRMLDHCLRPETLGLCLSRPGAHLLHDRALAAACACAPTHCWSTGLPCVLLCMGFRQQLVYVPQPAAVPKVPLFHLQEVFAVPVKTWSAIA